MSRKIISTSKAPKPRPTCRQAVKAGGLIFVSGTGPCDPDSGEIVGAAVQALCRQCLAGISAIPETAGGYLLKALSATLILLEESGFAGMRISVAAIAGARGRHMKARHMQ